MLANTKRNFLCFNDKTFYDFIFYLFYSCGIVRCYKFKYHGNVKHLSCFCSNICNFLLNSFVSIIYFLSCVSLWYHSKNDDRRPAFGYFCLGFIQTLNRFYLCKDLRRFRSIANKLLHISRSVNGMNQTPVWIKIWGFMNLCINFAILVLGWYGGADPEFMFIIWFEFQSSSRIVRCLFGFIFSLGTFILVNMPAYVFALYYAKICWDIKHSMNGFRKYVRGCPTDKYDQLSEFYVHIRTLVRGIDSKVGYFVFLSVMFNAVYMYIGLAGVLHAKERENFSSYYSILLSCLLCFVNFIAKVTAASLVPDEFSLLKTEVKCLKEGSERYNGSYKRFLRIVDEDVFMSMWGILSIRRSTVLGTLGSILTYCLLVDSVKSDGN